MKNFAKLILAINLGVLFFSSPALALRESRSTSIDERIKVITYNPDDVFKFTGFYGYQSSIELGEGETIDTISMGDTLAWQIVPAGKRIFLKPMEQDATTNMTVLTNKRTYLFELHAKEASDINDPEMAFVLRFIYPEESGMGGAVQTYASNAQGIDLEEDAEKYNFNYTISGDDYSAPSMIFDDGEFTYVEFRDKNAEIPAFFMVDKNGSESLMNYSVQGKYIVLQRVVARMTFRNGSYVTCIFNEENEESQPFLW